MKIGMHVVNVAIRNSKPMKKGRKVRSKYKRNKYIAYCVFAILVLLSFIIIPALYACQCMDEANAVALSSMALSLAFPVASFAYLFAKGNTLKQSIKKLGLSKDKLAKRYVALGISLFVLFFATQIAASIIANAMHSAINTNVESTIGNLPLYFFVFVVLIAPFDEEIFFRGFLVPRLGIVLSALLFGALHYLSYFSLAEFIAALAFGLAAGYAFKKTGSLYTTVIGHMLFDLVNVVLILW